MRKVVVSSFVSLDGYCEGPGKSLMGLPFDNGFNTYNLERIRTAGTLLSGKTSYEQFVSYWPTLADDESVDDTQREISRYNNELEKVVVSDTLTLEETGPWATSTTIVPRADAIATVDKLRQGDGGDILIFGSRTTWNPLFAAGRVDEIHLQIGPAVVGGGTPVFDGSTEAPLELIGSRKLDDSSIVVVQYKVTSAAS